MCVLRVLREKLYRRDRYSGIDGDAAVRFPGELVLVLRRTSAVAAHLYSQDTSVFP